jgi:hypothetical protein
MSALAPWRVRVRRSTPHSRSQSRSAKRGPTRVVAVCLSPQANYRGDGAPFRANRCLAFGCVLPLSSKKVEAGIRQRLLLPKCRPSEPKLKIGAPPGNAGGRRTSTAPIGSRWPRRASRYIALSGRRAARFSGARRHQVTSLPEKISVPRRLIAMSACWFHPYVALLDAVDNLLRIELSISVRKRE